MRFAEQVAKAYRTETGTPLELIVDRDTLNWGERWRNRLTTELARATFLLAMVTPSYIRSEVCRQEFLEFRSGEATKAHDGILALLVKDPRWNRPDVVNDPLVAQIRETVSERQWLTLEHPLEELEVDTPAVPQDCPGRGHGLGRTGRCVRFRTSTRGERSRALRAGQRGRPAGTARTNQGRTHSPVHRTHLGVRAGHDKPVPGLHRETRLTPPGAYSAVISSHQHHPSAGAETAALDEASRALSPKHRDE